MYSIQIVAFLRKALTFLIKGKDFAFPINCPVEMVKLTVTTLMTSVMESGIAVSMAGMNYIVEIATLCIAVVKEALSAIPRVTAVMALDFVPTKWMRRTVPLSPAEHTMERSCAGTRTVCMRPGSVTRQMTAGTGVMK